MNGYTPDTGEVRDSLVFLNKHYAKQHGDVDLLVVGSETAAQFDRMIAEVERAAAARALEEAADADDRQADYLIDTMPDAFSGLAYERYQKREESYELRRSAIRLRARAAAIREGDRDV